MLNEIFENNEIKKLKGALLSGNSILTEGLWNAPKALIASLAQEVTSKHVLILTAGNQEEQQLFHDFSLFTNCPVVDFPAWETLPSENTAPSPDIVGERYNVLKEITSTKKPHIILSGLHACLQRLLPPETFESLNLELKVGETISYEKLIQSLTEMGYQRSSIAADKGEFAIRGGIIDVFPVSTPDPYRIEFWDNEITSIRLYDPVGQKSIRQTEMITIMPARELELIRDKKKLSLLLDYLGPNTIVIFDDLLALEDHYSSLLAIAATASGPFGSIETLLDKIAPLQKIFWSRSRIEELSEISVLNPLEKSYYSKQAPLYEIAFEMFNRDLQAFRWQHPFCMVADFLLPDQEEVSGQELLHALSKLTSDSKLHFLCASPLEEETLQRRLVDANITLSNHTGYHIGYLSSGLVIPESNTLLLPFTEISHRYKIRRQKQRSTYHTVPFLQTFDLLPGEPVVHLNHGIGKYAGLEKKPDHQGILAEFITIEYAEKSKLYVPLNQAYLVTKYVGAGEELPSLSSLANNRWKKIRERTEQQIQAYAAEILEVYAKRELAGGFTYQADSLDLKAFEEDFPYTETEDQKLAIAAIKEDMMSGKCMDRLVCGDVGYGKTEVAMRAAFKAVADGNKQVAVLVPTTVLAMQHYDTFVERMSNFPINIGVLSRFRTAKQIKETLKGLAEGTIDIVIGTHRIISKDIIFKDLGLIIIDEEQRFGVKAKEHLKKIKVGVNCLTLSATPIPRTLYLSLIGTRDMSVISTPPQDRLPVTTVVSETSDHILKTALLREMARDGQAYIIHNRIETIYDVSSRIKKLLPQARVVVCHGQMDSDEIDNVFHLFRKGQADILIATTIIENGIDIPNANTILIDRADRFGLSDLYQLRGRVGRWNRRAYAYFLVPKPHALSEITRKRLNALIESSGYGGGIKLAMQDLHIRGPGNILGDEQSGLVATIGFHLYCKMLKKTMQALQGKISPETTETKIEFQIDARLPEEYISEVNLRIEIYQRLGESSSLEEVDTIWNELIDRFGKPPTPAKWLYHMTRVKVYGSCHGYSLLKLDKYALTTEQKQKNKPPIVKKFLTGPFKGPEEFETKIIGLLKTK